MSVCGCASLRAPASDVRVVGAVVSMVGMALTFGGHPYISVTREVGISAW